VAAQTGCRRNYREVINDPATAGLNFIAIHGTAMLSHTIRMPMQTTSADSTTTGSPLKAFIICYAVTILGIVMVLLPILFDGVEKAMGDGAFAMMLVGGFFAVTAFFSSFVFRHRLRVYRELFHEEQLLAHWRYSEDEWHAFAGAELATEKSVKKLIVLITAGFALLYCGLMAVLYPKLTVLMIGVGLTIIALVAGAAALSTRISRRRNLTPTGEARIGRHGIWLNGALHTWSGGGSYLVDCNLDNSIEPQCLVFSYAAIERHGPQIHQARMPVPHNHLDEARQVIAALRPDFKPNLRRKVN